MDPHEKKVWFPPSLVPTKGDNEESKAFIAEFGNRWESRDGFGMFIIYSWYRNIIVTVGKDFDYHNLHFHSCSMDEFVLFYRTMDEFRTPDLIVPLSIDHEWIYPTILKAIPKLDLYEGIPEFKLEV